MDGLRLPVNVGKFSQEPRGGINFALHDPTLPCGYAPGRIQRRA
jgi:hypothetical protein